MWEGAGEEVVKDRPVRFSVRGGGDGRCIAGDCCSRRLGDLSRAMGLREWAVMNVILDASCSRDVALEGGEEASAVGSGAMNRHARESVIDVKV